HWLAAESRRDLPKENSMTSPTSHMPIDQETQSLSTRQLLTRLIDTVSLFVANEVALERAAFKADLKAELSRVTLLCVAAVLAVFSVGMILVAAVFAIAVWMPGWLAALGMAGRLFLVGAGVGALGVES